MNKNMESDNLTERYKSLQSKLNKMFSDKPIEPNGDEVSLFDVRIAIDDFVGKENELFINNIDKDIKAMNRRNALLLGHKRKNIDHIDFVVSNKKGYYCIVYLTDEKGRVVSTERVDNFAKLGVGSPEVLKNIKFFMKYLNALDMFKMRNYNVEYIWSKKTPHIKSQQFDDGFFTYCVDMNDKSRNGLFFSNLDDASICREKIGTDVSPLELIEFYDDCFTKRISVNLNDLDPFIANVVRKHYGLESKKLVK